MTSRYGWVITKDLFPFAEPDENPDTGTVGPGGIDGELEARLKAGEGQEFRMYDDDDNLMYEGRYIGPSDEDLFAPLNDFGMPNVGCTTIHYKNAEGVFEPI